MPPSGTWSGLERKVMPAPCCEIGREMPLCCVCCIYLERRVRGVLLLVRQTLVNAPAEVKVRFILFMGHVA